MHSADSSLWTLRTQHKIESALRSDGNGSENSPIFVWFVWNGHSLHKSDSHPGWIDHRDMTRTPRLVRRRLVVDWLVVVVVSLAGAAATEVLLRDRLRQRTKNSY